MGRRKNKQRDSLVTLTNSLTIHSFADSEKVPSSEKLPKSFSSRSLTRVAAAASVEDDVDVSVEPDEDGETIDEANKPVEKRDRKALKQVSIDADTAPGRRLPYDVWELLGNYILPCTVGKFAAICKDSHAVVQRPQFWIKLYRDFYHLGCDLPIRLQPENVIFRPQGLRSNVIRSLFYMYKPFIDHLKRPQVQICDPHELKGKLCVKLWHSRKLKEHHFYIKFARSAAATQIKIKSRSNVSQDNDTWDDPISDNLFSVNDLNFNPEDGCSLLHLNCSDFNVVSSNIVGQKLNDVCLTMSGQGFRYQKLTLSFVPAHSRSIHCSELNIVDIQSIVNMKIVKWYYPHYVA